MQIDARFLPSEAALAAVGSHSDGPVGEIAERRMEMKNAGKNHDNRAAASIRTRAHKSMLS
jgi:hypothetical protein